MRLILGRAGTGKHKFLTDALLTDAKGGGRALLIVPEQSSFSFERQLYFLVPKDAAERVEVKSFSKLAEELLRAGGKAAVPRANDAARIAVVRRAAASLGSSLAYYRRSRDDIAFLSTAAKVFEELKNAAVDPPRLSQMAEDAPSPLSVKKFRELSALYAAYEQMLHQSFEDDADRLTAAAEIAGEKSAFFLGKTVYMDGFTGFTEPEYAMIGRMVQTAGDLVVTMMCDGEKEGSELFSTVRRNAARLKRMAEDAGKPCSVTLLGETGSMSCGLAALERFLSDPDSEGTSAGGVRVIAADDPYDEMERVASEITALVRDRGFHFSDMAVIARDIEGYRTAIRRSFRLYGIPYFADWAENERFSPAAVFVLAALALLREFSAEHLLTLLKTRLTKLSIPEIASFEDYVYVWGVGPKELASPFENNPDGLLPEMSEQAANRLTEAERVRGRVMRWVAPLIKKAKGHTAGDTVREIFLLMKRCGAMETLRLSGGAEGAVLLLEQLHRIAGDEPMTPQLLSEIASALFLGTKIGEIPEAIERLQVGEADRIRTNNPKVVFAVGLNEGVFPRTDFDAPLLTFAERDHILQSGADIARGFDNLLKMEALHLYNALTSASEMVYLCYPKASVKGDSLRPSAQIAAYIGRFSPEGPMTVDDRLAPVVNAATAKRAYLEKPALRRIIRDSGLFDFCDRMDAAANSPRYALPAAGGPARDIYLSPSRIETFENCRFQYFLRYVTDIRPIDPAAMTPLEAGNFIHAVMESVFSRSGGNLRELPPETLRRFSDDGADRYIQTVLGQPIRRSARIRYQIGRLKEQARRLVFYMQKEQMQSVFTPAAFELSVSPEDGIAPRKLMLPDGSSVIVTGKIDRVDIAEIDGLRYLRVVDYKTGVKTFSLDDVYYGLNMQMLLYLFSVTENGKDRFGETIPAGVLYMPADPRIPVYDEKKDIGRESYRMDGLVLEDPKVIRAMERDAAGVFIPVRNKPDGTVDRRPAKKLADLAQMGAIRRHIDGTVLAMAEMLRGGEIDAEPMQKGGRFPCDYCRYTAVCRRDRVTKERVFESIDPRTAFLKAGDPPA